MREYPKPQEIYRHFKGKLYQIITLARNSETEEKMVVYQQLYAPFEVYVRPLELFMSKVDARKYPNEKQIYRFEQINLCEENAGNDVESSTEYPEDQATAANSDEVGMLPIQNNIATAQEPALAPGLMAFLDADSYEQKLEILSALHPIITDQMIDTMAVSLDTEVKDGDIEQRYNDIKNCLITMERFECNRLR